MNKPTLTDAQMKQIDDMIAYRKDLHMSQSEFAEAIGSSYATIAHVEQRIYPVSLALQKKIDTFAYNRRNAVSNMAEFKKALLETYSNDVLITENISCIVDYISSIVIADNLKKIDDQIAYTNFLERTLAEYKHVCMEVAQQIEKGKQQDISGPVAGLSKSINTQWKRATDDSDFKY